MPPTRRQLRALGSLQLVGYANNPTKVITELAFIADAQTNNPGGGGHSDVDTPLEVQFDEFMDGVNSRGKGTKTRQRKTTVEQAAAVLLVTVQKGLVELITKKNDPHIINVIRILPEAKRILASFLPKLRGYGDIPYEQQYRGAIALAKRHFFPKGQAPTKKELMALLLQSYQEKRELGRIQRQSQSQATKTLGIQTSFIDRSSHTGIAKGESVTCVHSAACANTVELPIQRNSSVEQPNDDAIADVESTAVASEADPADLGDNENHEVSPEHEIDPVQLVTSTPVAPRCFNPYLTPLSNPRHAEHAHTAAAPSPFDASPIPVISSLDESTLDEDGSTDEGIGELLQTTATTQGRLNFYYNKFVAACQRITFLEGQKEEMEREFDVTKRKLDETEQRLREANDDRGRLKGWVNTLRRRVDSIHSQLGLLREMADPNGIDNEGCAGYGEL